MRHIAIVVVLVALSACSSRAEQLEEQFEIASPAEHCRLATEIADAYLEQTDEKNYRMWRLRASGICFQDDLQRQARQNFLNQ